MKDVTSTTGKCVDRLANNESRLAAMEAKMEFIIDAITSRHQQVPHASASCPWCLDMLYLAVTGIGRRSDEEGSV